MASFRFLHAADIHLDSPLKGLTGQEGNAVERIRTATREALRNLVSQAIEEKVDFLIISGDLYDGDWRDYKTGLFFVGQVGRLNREGIPVYMLYGNHDAESLITKSLERPDNVYVFGSRKPETFKIDELDVALHGQSFHQREVTENLVPAYPEPISGAFNIGVLHTGLGGVDGHANYAPCSRGDLVNKGYDYWALGHVHNADVLHKRPHIVFPGNLQGRHVRETGAKGAYLVTVEDGEIANLAPIHCDVARWAVLQVSLDGSENLSEVADRIRDELQTAVDNESSDGGRLLVCRINLVGRTDIHAQILTSADQILADARANALGFGDEVAWVEKIMVSTEPTIDEETLARREDAIGALQQMLPSAASDEMLIAEIKKDIGELVGKLPHGVREGIEDPSLKLAVKGEYTDLISKVAPHLTARLIFNED